VHRTILANGPMDKQTDRTMEQPTSVRPHNNTRQPVVTGGR